MAPSMRPVRPTLLLCRGTACCALALLVILLASPAPAGGQAAAVASVAEEGQPAGFRGIRVGMSLEEVKDRLTKEPLFLYRGDPDVSLVPATRQTLIEVPGSTFVERGYFQFHEGKLLVMIVVLSRELVSYFEVYSQLSSHYGGASFLDPSQAVWELSGVRLSLEKPVVLKYVDSVTFASLKDKSRAGRDYEAETLARFLEKL